MKLFWIQTSCLFFFTVVMIKNILCYHVHKTIFLTFVQVANYYKMLSGLCIIAKDEKFALPGNI